MGRYVQIFKEQVSELMKRQITPEDLQGKVKAVVEYFLANPTSTHKQIAQVVGLSEGRISQILRSPRVTGLYPILARRTMQSRLLPKAMVKYEELLSKGKNEAVVEKVASSVLRNENVLDGPKLTIENNITLKSVSELREIVQRAAVINEPVLDAEIVSENPQSTIQGTVQE